MKKFARKLALSEELTKSVWLAYLELTALNTIKTVPDMLCGICSSICRRVLSGSGVWLQFEDFKLLFNYHRSELRRNDQIGRVMNLPAFRLAAIKREIANIITSLRGRRKMTVNNRGISWIPEIYFSLC